MQKILKNKLISNKLNKLKILILLNIFFINYQTYTMKIETPKRLTKENSQNQPETPRNQKMSPKEYKEYVKNELKVVTIMLKNLNFFEKAPKITPQTPINNSRKNTLSGKKRKKDDSDSWWPPEPRGEPAYTRRKIETQDKK